MKAFPGVDPSDDYFVFSEFTATQTLGSSKLRMVVYEEPTHGGSTFSAPLDLPRGNAKAPASKQFPHSLSSSGPKITRKRGLLVKSCCRAASREERLDHTMPSRKGTLPSKESNVRVLPIGMGVPTNVTELQIVGKTLALWPERLQILLASGDVYPTMKYISSRRTFGACGDWRGNNWRIFIERLQQNFRPLFRLELYFYIRYELREASMAFLKMLLRDQRLNREVPRFGP